MNEKLKKGFIQAIIILVPTIILSIVCSSNAFASIETLSCESKRLSLNDNNNLEYKYHSTVYPTIIKNDQKITYVYSSAGMKWEYYFQIVEETNKFFIGEEISPPLNTIKSLIFFRKESKFYERIFVNINAVTLTHGNCR
tara:strand:- start:617 stop:1036 length:420 start_codon:yes stop_codon:yes gene_type:complete